MSGRSRIAHFSITRIALIALAAFASTSAVAACGGVAKQEAMPFASHAGAANVDSGVGETAAVDASSLLEATVEVDADTTAPSPSASQICCDTWTGVRSQLTCVQALCSCAGHQIPQPTESECIASPMVCHVDTLADLDGKACSPELPLCRFGSGCSACQCECPEDTQVWRCVCNAC